LAIVLSSPFRINHFASVSATSNTLCLTWRAKNQSDSRFPHSITVQAKGIVKGVLLRFALFFLRFSLWDRLHGAAQSVLSNMSVALRHPDRRGWAPAHQGREHGKGCTTFQHARASGMPQVVKTALNGGPRARGLPGFLPAAGGFRRIRLVGACHKILSRCAVSFRGEHQIGRLIRSLA